MDKKPFRSPTMLIEASASVYGDELITATELNQQPGQVLDKAWERPVTITRNEQHFALLRRDRITYMVKAAKMSQVVIELIDVAYRSRLGEQISSEHPLEWVKAFDNDELRELIAEVENAYRLVGSDPQAWDNLEALIHEWQESAIAINSKELAAAFSDRLSVTKLPTTRLSYHP
ncbi:hypothetical protein [Floridanema aerugineum]|uniref:Uncharacterized protein n=1 Tax=Floridaenema aerugineum BLCC-F46 TaxID=3153654 RepID=A0ABV4WYT6_9CYAN